MRPASWTVGPVSAGGAGGVDAGTWWNARVTGPGATNVTVRRVASNLGSDASFTGALGPEPRLYAVTCGAPAGSLSGVRKITLTRYWLVVGSGIARDCQSRLVSSKVRDSWTSLASLGVTAPGSGGGGANWAVPCSWSACMA